jgi:hypothetical protein
MIKHQRGRARRSRGIVAVAVGVALVTATTGSGRAAALPDLAAQRPYRIWPRSGPTGSGRAAALPALARTVVDGGLRRRRRLKLFAALAVSARVTGCAGRPACASC